MRINENDRKETEFIIHKYDIDTEFRLTELKLKQEELTSNIQDRRERKKYADKIFYFLASFMIITLTVVFISIFKFNQLSDTVLVTLLTTTSANVISIFLIVVRYLFKAKE